MTGEKKNRNKNEMLACMGHGVIIGNTQSVSISFLFLFFFSPVIPISYQNTYLQNVFIY